MNVVNKLCNNNDVDILDVLENLNETTALLLLLLLTYQSYTSVTDRQETHVTMLTSTLHATPRRYRLLVPTAHTTSPRQHNTSV